jgi:hypothetical protein
MVELESTYGVPTVAVHVSVFAGLVASTVKMHGMPRARQVFVPTPVLNKSPAELRGYVEGDDPVRHRPLMTEVFEELTRPLAPEDIRGIGFDRSTPRFLEPDTEDNLHRLFMDRRWTDFLPIVLPTEERVEAMLRGTSHPPDEVVGHLRPTGGWEAWEFDVEKVAINAVMAGASPEHFPVILALAASGDTARNASMSSMGRMVVVNGPIRDELSMNSGIGAMGPFSHANSAIGRGFGLLSQNLQGGSVPGFSYQGSQGNNLAYNSCTFAENEEGSPWAPFHVRQGFAKDESAVTIFWVWGYFWVEHLRPYWAEKLQSMLASMEPSFGVTFVVDPIVAREFVERGFDTPEKIAGWVHEQVKVPRRRYWDHISLVSSTRAAVDAGVEPWAGYWNAAPDDPIPVFEPNRVHVVVAGGATNGDFYVFMGAARRGRFGAAGASSASMSIDAWR